MPLPSINQISEQDAQALVAFLEQGAGTDDGAKRLVVLRAILSALAMQAAMIDRLERRAFLDEAAVQAIGQAVSSAYNLAALQQAFGSPAKGADIGAAMDRIAELTTAVRNQSDAVKMFTDIAKIGLSIAKAFV